MSNDVEFVLLKTFQTRFEAEVCKNFLASQTIQSFIQADDEGGMYPFPLKPTTTEAKLFVNKIDLSKAKKLLLQTKENIA